MAIPSSRRSSQPRDQTQVTCITGRFFAIWATKFAPRLSSTSFCLPERLLLFSALWMTIFLGSMFWTQQDKRWKSMLILNSSTLTYLVFFSDRKVLYIILYSTSFILACGLKLANNHHTNIPQNFCMEILMIRWRQPAFLISRQLTFFMVDIELWSIIYSLLQIMPRQGFRWFIRW